MIPGGALSCTGLTPGSTATVSCEDGYELSEGNGELVCQDDGTWDGTTSQCVPLGKIPTVFVVVILFSH